MESSRWWHVAVIGTAAVLSVMVAWGHPLDAQTAGALAANGVFVLAWLIVGRHAVHSPTAATAFIVITIIVAGIGAAFSPSMATIQTIAYPIIWVLSRRLLDAVLASIALATSVGIGIFISTGSLLQTLVVQGISLAFSVALGLWITSIANRSDERQRLLDELRLAQDRLAVVNRDAGVTSERERLAREIHDTIAQDLTGLVLITQRARRELGSGALEAVAQQLELLEENARAALAETRALVAASAPVSLSNAGVRDAVERLAERFERETSIRVASEIGELPPLDRDTEVVLLRCAQESLANVRKHSAATAATVSIRSTAASVMLEVSDNGHGFDPQVPSTGFGLDGMRERLALVGGSLVISSDPGRTLVTATLPLGVAS